jgi:hypothetical protein
MVGAMVTGKIVEYNQILQNTGFLQNMVLFLQGMQGLIIWPSLCNTYQLLGDVEQKIIECFRKGGGVPYSSFPRFQQLQAEDTARVFDARLIDQIVRLLDGLGDRLRAGIDVLDVDVVNVMQSILWLGIFLTVGLLAMIFQRKALKPLEKKPSRWN